MAGQQLVGHGRASAGACMLTWPWTGLGGTKGLITACCARVLMLQPACETSGEREAEASGLGWRQRRWRRRPANGGLPRTQMPVELVCQAAVAPNYGCSRGIPGEPRLFALAGKGHTPAAGAARWP